ncbi:MAG: hypothetical protein N3E42_04455 [Candidatus Bipolaricaulota bacterium]|nr:hypothetical protein [Candidatus Bipolaricaulota bacterium]
MVHRTVRTVTTLWLCLLMGLAVLVSAQEETPEEQPPDEETLSVNYFGELGWTVKYGLGDSRELSRHGYANQVLFEQYIALTLDAGVQIDWPISGVLRVSAQLDNRKANNLQSFKLGYKAQTVEAAFEDFSMRAGSSDFVATDRLLKGLRFSWDISEAMQLAGKFARVEGISQVRIFRGNTSQQIVEFTLNDPERPWLEATYQRNLKGLEYVQVRSYVPGFTAVSLHFELTPELRTLLTNYGLDYLIGIIEDDPEPEVAAELYDVIVENGSHTLVLKRPTLELLRDQIHTYITEYNDEHNLFDENAKEYPFGEGTDYEQGFLKNLSKLVRLSTPEETFSLESVKRGRFFYLGSESVKEETITIEIKRQGTYLQVPDPDLPQFRFALFPDQGIIALDFPEEFFTNPQSAVRVTFDYTVPGGFYMLGLAVLQNSERVYLKREGEQDFKLLKRDQDYQIDYETGALLLLPPYDALGDQDELKIEYELLRGGLGGAAEHQRVFMGLSYQWTPWPFFRLSLDALRAFDTPPSEENRDRLRTMPNTHSVLGLGAQLTLGDLTADLKLGYTENIFPTVPFSGAHISHTNERLNQRNRVNVIAGLTFEGRRIMLFGHQNGLLVYDGSRWQEFTTKHGMSGRGVRGIAIQRNTVLLATELGLSLVKLDPGRPVLESLAKPINWKSFYSVDGLPHNETYDVLIDRSGTVWVGTRGGLARVSLTQITEKSAWKVFKKSTTPTLKSEAIKRLASDGTQLYLGTDVGLMVYDPETEQFSEIAELRGQEILDLAASGTTVYVATARGIYELSNGVGVGWRIADLKVHALAMQDTELWYGTEIGLFRLGSDAPIIQEYEITAIERNARSEQLWVGPRASALFEMPLWEIDASGLVKARTQAETRLNGRDEFRFEDIPADKNTDHGWLVQLSAEYKLGSLEITALLEGITPQFLAIGQESRRDAQRLTLSASWPVSPSLSLAGDHVMSLAGGWRTFIITDTVRVSWKPWEAGPALSSTLALELTDRDLHDRSVGFDMTKLTLNLKGDHKMDASGLLPLAQEMTLGGTYDGLLTLARFGRSLLDSKVGFTVGLALTPSLKLRGSVTLGDRITFGAQRLPGDSELSYTLGGDWQYNVGFGQLTTSYTRTTRLRAGRGSLDENASLNMRFSDLTLSGIKLSPTLALSGRRTTSIGSTPPTGTLTLTAEGRTPFSWQTLSGSLSTRHTFSTDVRSLRDSLKHEITTSLAWALSPQLQPRLELGLTLDTLTHPTLGSKQTVRPRARLSLDWTPATLWKTGADLFWQMTLSERERTTTFELGGRVSWDPLDELSLSFDARASLDLGRRDQRPISAATWEMSIQGEYELGTVCAPALEGSDCSFSATLGYSGRLDHRIAVPFGQGIFAQAQLGLNF